MILTSRKQMASVSLRIDIVETLAPIPYVTFVLRFEHHPQSRDWYDVCVGHLSLSAARDRQPPKFCPNP